MEALTINKLAQYCKHAQNKGLGNKKILISSDDEGNEYHELFFAFTEIGDGEDMFIPYEYQLHGVSLEDAIGHYVVLG